jgi:XTP/dITP diphosphohydrolase
MSSPSINRLVIATHNRGKLREFIDLLEPYVREIVSAGDLGLPSPEETGVSCQENAILKARFVSKALGKTTDLVLADDSGFFVTAIDGRPGVHAADWVKPDAIAAMKRVQNELGDAKDRSAYFLCVLALHWPDGRVDLIEGRIEGTVAREPKGKGGHGYDPIFIPEGKTQTFGEMSEHEKNTISHRGRASAKLIVEYLSKI